MARLYALTSLLFVVAVVFIINIWLVHHNLNCTCDCSAVDISPLDRQSRAAEDNAKRPLTKERLSTGEREGHHLAVVVPFRNRFEELLQFAPFLHSFLNRQHVRHQIWVVNQADNHRLEFLSSSSPDVAQVKPQYITKHQNRLELTFSTIQLSDSGTYCVLCQQQCWYSVQGVQLLVYHQGSFQIDELYGGPHSVIADTHIEGSASPHSFVPCDHAPAFLMEGLL
eukprot:Em0013g151a